MGLAIGGYSNHQLVIIMAKIDLGIKDEDQSPTISIAAGSESEASVHYPTLYIRSGEKLSFPKGNFKFTGEAKVVSQTEREPKAGEDDDETSCSYELEVYSITPAGSVPTPKGKPGLETDLADSMRASMKKRMGMQDEEGDSEDEEDY